MSEFSNILQNYQLDNRLDEEWRKLIAVTDNLTRELELAEKNMTDMDLKLTDLDRRLARLEADQASLPFVRASYPSGHPSFPSVQASVRAYPSCLAFVQASSYRASPYPCSYPCLHK